MHITLRQLQVFVSIAHAGGVSAAAEQIGLSQSATSMALAELENQLDAPLFDRIGRRLQLNALGQTQLPLAERILSQVREFEQVANQSVQGPLTIAASLTIGSYLLPGLAARYMQNYPEVDLQLRLRNTADVLSSVSRMEADLGLIEGLCQDERLECLPWRQDRLVIIAASDSPWAQQRLDRHTLLQAPWILREAGSGTRAIFEQAWGKDMPKLKVQLELGQQEAIKQAVMAGLGLGCLSALAVQDEVAHGKLCILDHAELDLSRWLSLVRLPHRYQSPAAQAWVQHLELPSA